ncbi:MAG TPA: hypothetical protein PKD79_00525 [Candidatus Doudnabacteria bacterium]|nr:hypothetical protein [Candidatus Doudnabacteria bacterium]
MYHDKNTDPRPKSKEKSRQNLDSTPLYSGSFAAVQPPPENFPLKHSEIGVEVLAIFLIALYLCFALSANRSGGFFLYP